MKQTLNYREEYLPINRKKQYLVHFPSDKKDAPVVLVLHGQFDIAASITAHVYQKELSSACTVVYWDQLGTGKTLTANPKIFPSMEHLLKDLFVVISCLKLVYGKDKIYLAGYSFGNLLGMAYAQQHPEDLACYIGVAPILNLYNNEAASISQLQEKVCMQNNGRTLEHLMLSPGDNGEAAIKKYAKLGKYLEKHQQGATRSQLLRMSLRSPLFHWSDLRSALRAAQQNTRMWNYALTQNEQDQRWKIPLHMIVGEDDLFAPPSLMNAYMAVTDAPVKKLHTIPDAGHAIMIDQPQKFARCLEEILDY